VVKIHCLSTRLVCPGPRRLELVFIGGQDEDTQFDDDKAQKLSIINAV